MLLGTAGHVRARAGRDESYGGLFRWLAGDRWSGVGGQWSAYYRVAAAVVLLVAVLVALLVWGLARVLVAYGIEQRGTDRNGSEL